MKNKKNKPLSINNIIIFLYSVYFNIRYLPFSIGRKIPILISPKVKIWELRRDSIQLPEIVSFGLIRFGLNCSFGIEANRGFLSVAEGAKLVFHGKAKLSSGISIRIDSGTITIGDRAFFNANCMMRCTNSISFGDGILVGWNVCFITDDGHSVFVDGQRRERMKPIIIGEHVWIASDTKIAKGTIIADNCIVAQNSLVNSSFNENYALIGGVPAKVVKSNVTWIKYMQDEKII